MRPTAEPTRASIGVATAAWGLAFVGSVIAATIVRGASGHATDEIADIPFGVISAWLAAGWLVQAAVLWYVSVRFLTGRPSTDYGLKFRPADLLGVPIGVLSQLVLLELVYWPLRRLFDDTFSTDRLEEPARELTDRAGGGWKVVLVVAVVVCAPLIEETLYRGLLLRSLDSRLADVLALVISALWFAAVHFQGIQFPGLFAFGLVLGACLQRTGRLGLGIVAHAAFNATSIALLW